MSNYFTFLGIDIGKTDVFVAIQGSKTVLSFENSKDGFKKFLKALGKELRQAFIVLETTGGYETLFLNALLDKKMAVHRANTRQVKSFIRSWGTLGKSDALDAQALARYGYERRHVLPLFQKQPPEIIKLANLAQRKQDLTHMLVQEKNRFKGPNKDAEILENWEKSIQFLTQNIADITQKIEALIQNHPTLCQQKEALRTIPGIEPIVSSMLLAFLPKLGNLNRRQIASLAGLAPYPCESGKKTGYRRTKGGRTQARSILFIAAMAARKSNSPLKAFYEKLIARGKKKMVALTALMRKIVTIANTKLKEFSIQTT